MNVDMVEVGMRIKNYKELCKLLGIEIKTGTSKRLQIQDIERYFNYERQGQSFIIKEIYDKEFTKAIDKRGSNMGCRGNNRKNFPNFLIDKADENKIGIYKIVLGKNIYIGSTIVGFRHRYLTHKGKNNSVPFTKDMLLNNATFEVIEICEGMTEPQIRFKENEYIESYKNNNDWFVINTRDAWSYAKRIKLKYRFLKIAEIDYEKAIKVLKENGLIK